MISAPLSVSPPGYYTSVKSAHNGPRRDATYVNGRVHGFGRLLCVAVVAVATMEKVVAVIYNDPELQQLRPPSHQQQQVDEEDGEDVNNAFYCNAAYR